MYTKNLTLIYPIENYVKLPLRPVLYVHVMFEYIQYGNNKLTALIRRECSGRGNREEERVRVREWITRIGVRRVLYYFKQIVRDTSTGQRWQPETANENKTGGRMCDDVFDVICWLADCCFSSAENGV